MLRTPRLILDQCCPSDSADFISLERDPEVMRYLNGGPVDHERVDPAVSPFLMPRGTEPFVWTARQAASGVFVGWFCLYPDSETVAEIGFRLRRETWGQGLATEGARALVDWGFSSGPYETITGCTMIVNHGSRRVMEKIGMTQDRVEFIDFPDPIPGADQGEVWYTLSRADWMPGRHQP